MNESETLTETNVIETALAKENVTNQVIAKLKTDYLGLKINGIDDKVNFKLVEDARKHCKSIRVLAVKICKAGREDAIKIQKGWIAKEKEIVAAIDETESHLEKESNRIKEEEKRILFEAAQKAKLPMRIEKLKSIDVTVQDEELLKINDDQFSALFNEFHEKHLQEKAEKLAAAQKLIDDEKAEQERKERERIAEEKRLKDIEDAKEQARLKAEEESKAAIAKAEKEAKEAKEREEQAKVEAEERERKAKEQAEIDKKEALAKAEQEKQEALAKLKREQEEKEERERKEREEQARLAEEKRQAEIEAELSKGDAAKMESLQSDLEGLKTKYAFKSKKHKAIYADVNNLLDKVVNHIIAKS